MPEALLGLVEVAEMLGVPQNTIYRWIHRREIPCFKVGRHVKFRASEIEGWLEERRIQPSERVTRSLRSIR